MKGQVDRTVESSVEYHKFQTAFYVHMKGSNCSNIPAPVRPLPENYMLWTTNKQEKRLYTFLCILHVQPNQDLIKPCQTADGRQ